MVKEFGNLLMVIDMKAIFLMTLEMEKEFIIFIQEMYILAIM